MLTIIELQKGRWKGGSRDGQDKEMQKRNGTDRDEYTGQEVRSEQSRITRSIMILIINPTICSHTYSHSQTEIVYSISFYNYRITTTIVIEVTIITIILW